MSPGARLSLFLCGVFMAAGISSAFLPLWLADRGLAPSEIGTVLALAAAGRVAVAPGWGRLADALPGRLVLTAAAIIALAGSLLLVAGAGFWPILLLVALQSAGASVLMPLGDAVSLALSREGRLDYGRVRAAASGAFMAANAAGGWALGAVGIAALPLLMAAGYAVSVAAGPTLPNPKTPRARSASLFAGLALLRHRAFLLVVLATAAVQGSHAAYYALGSLHWRNAGHSETVIGLLWAESLAAEILMFLCARRLLAGCSPAGLTAIAALAAMLRWTVLANTTHLPALVAIQLLHGATFGFQHLAAMQLLTHHIPPERAASAQTLHAAIGGTVSLGLVTWLSGRAYDGTGTVFLAMAAIAALALPLALTLRRV